MVGLKEAIDRVAELAVQAEKTEVVTIAGKTYANRNLVRYDTPKKAAAIHTHTLVSLLEYIEKCAGEFAGKKMTIHVESPERVRFISELDSERGRECLFEAEAEISAFRFGSWYEQENFMIALQSNFQPNDDLAAVMMLAGNIEKKNKQTFSDDGVSQVATMSVGVASKADAMVPNPVALTPFRTFMEVKQPSSKFVFRISGEETPQFKLVEAEGGIWKYEAIAHIKGYLLDGLGKMPEEIRNRIVVIG